MLLVLAKSNTRGGATAKAQSRDVVMSVEPLADARIAFGTEAQRFVDRLPSTLHVIAAQPIESVVLALPVAANYRRDGTMFYAAPLIDEPRANIALAISGELLRRTANVDERRSLFFSLAQQTLVINGAPQAEFRNFDQNHIGVLRDLIILSDAVLARSARDVDRIGRLIGYRRRFAIYPGADASVPDCVSVRREHLVVWAPHLDADRLGVIAMAMDLFKCPVVYVCASGELPNVRGEFVRPADAERALSGASCVIDAQISDPATALTMADLGHRVVVAATTGGSEFLDGLYEFNAWEFRSIYAAVVRALAALPPARKKHTPQLDDLARVLALAAPPPLVRGPVVSVVVPTYNRRQLLASCLERFTKQTYQSLDIIVVNDGGVDVADICARYGSVRLLTLENNLGVSGACRAGIDLIDGKYFAFWPDDDILFPDHYSRLVQALETTGGYIAHTQTLTRYHVDHGDRLRTRAYKIHHDRPNDPVELLAFAQVCLSFILFRREVLEEIGGFDPTDVFCDVEYQMRASAKYDFLQVDAVTGQWNYSMQGNTWTQHIGRERFIDGQRRIYEKYPTASARIETCRADWLKYVGDHFDSVLWQPDMYLPESFGD